MPPPLVVASPLLLLFEMTQLVLAERHLGVRQIERGVDPRVAPLTPGLARLWTTGIVLNWFWLLAMLPWGFGTGQIVGMLAVSVVGYAIRRHCGLRWVLVALTFEGAVRIGLHVSLLGTAWQAL